MTSERSSADSGVEMQSWRSSGSSARSSGLALSAEGGAGGKVLMWVRAWTGGSKTPSSLRPRGLVEGSGGHPGWGRNTNYTQTTLGSGFIPDTIRPCGGRGKGRVGDRDRDTHKKRSGRFYNLNL